MTVDPDKRIERLRERIGEGEELSSADQEALMDFSDRLFLLSSRYGDHRHEHLLRRCIRMAEEVGNLADTTHDREATEEIVRWIHRQYDNEETNKDYRVSLRMFALHTTDGDDIPDTVEWVPSGTSRNYQPAPDPGDMLHWDEDVRPMIDAARYSRGAAMIAVAWDSGARSGEFRSLSVGDVTDHNRGLMITVDGKTGQRSIPLITSVPYLQRWLEDHPAPDDPDAPLWCKLHSPDEFSYNMYRKILEGAAEDAGVDKPVTLTNFRKSSASYLASRGVNQAVLEEHHGWTRGSRVAARYVSVFADASDREIAKAHGIDVEEDEPDPLAPKICPRCGEATERGRDTCMHCQASLDIETAQLLEMVTDRLDNQLVEQTNPDKRSQIIDIRRTAERNPEKLDIDQLHSMVTSSED